MIAILASLIHDSTYGLYSDSPKALRNIVIDRFMSLSPFTLGTGLIFTRKIRICGGVVPFTVNLVT